MYKLFLILLFLPLRLCNAQTNFWQHTNGPHGGSIYDYSIDSSGEIYGATSNGVFISLDNGLNWNYRGLQGKLIYSVCKLSNGIALAGAYGEGLFRSNSVSLWEASNLNAPYIIDIKEIESGIILAASSTGVYRSTNFGLNWSSVLQTYANSISRSPVSNVVYVACQQGLFSSSDIGTTWQEVVSLSEHYLRDVNVADNGFIFVAGTESRLHRSTDNGKNFSIMHPDSIYEPSSVTTTPNGYVYCTTYHERIWRSTNNGDNWINLGYDRDTYKLFRGNNNEVFAYVFGLGSVKTTNGGLNWVGSANGIVNTYVEAMVKASDGTIISSTGQVSHDDGMNWVIQPGLLVTSDFAINSKNGFLYTVNGTNGVYRSTDNGINWNLYNINSSTARPQWITIFENKEIYAGRNGGVFKSTNDGVNWTQFTSQFLTSFTKTNSGHYYGGSTDGIYKSTNEGLNWSQVLSFPNPTNYVYNPVFTASDNTVYAGGVPGLYSTTNDGVSWENENIPCKIRKIIETENGKLFVICYDFYYYNSGGIYTKSGNTWQDITHNLEWKNISSICFNDYGQLLVGTNGAGVSRSINSVIGIDNINSLILNGFRIYQNFPNPFNPSTVIRYSLIENRVVKLTVFDALGKMISTLVNEKQNAGTYEVDFNGADLPSGVYFYTLTCGSNSVTRKMLLLK